MTPKKKRRNSIVEIGTGPAKVTIYTLNRKDGFSEFTLSWKEGGRRKRRSLACMDEARLVAQQITVRLTNGWVVGDETSKRDLQLLSHCEGLAKQFGVSLSVAIEEWASARKAAGDLAISDAVRFYVASRTDLLAVKSIKEVAAEFVESRRTLGVSEIYVRNCTAYTKRFEEKLGGNIADVTTIDINKYLAGLKTLGPVSKNINRSVLVSMFGFARSQGYLHPERKTAAALSGTFKAPETKIQIFTPAEMEKLLLASHARMLPLLAIGAFAGIRSAEIRRLHWEDIKWDRNFIEIAGWKAKTAARRLVPLTENLKAWLAPWRQHTGLIVRLSNPSGALSDIAVKAQVAGGWRQNGLRHSYISYRVAQTGDVARTALEAGNTPKMIFRHYREVVDEESAIVWFSIMPPEGWEPGGLRWMPREML
jgi:integrase